MGFALLITGDWLINCMNSTVLPLWREWWHSDSLPGERLLFPIPPMHGRQAQVKKSVADTTLNYHWETRGYPQQTGCKQWLRPWVKSKGQQQFRCFMAREKYKVSVAGQRAPETLLVQPRGHEHRQHQKKGLQSKVCGFPGCSLLPSLCRGRRSSSDLFPMGQAPTPQHFSHSHCIPGKHPAAQWLLTLQLCEVCVAQRAFSSA